MKAFVYKIPNEDHNIRALSELASAIKKPLYQTDEELY